MNGPLLALNDVSKKFGNRIVADRLSMSIDRGEFFTFLGPSGSGKSTVLRMIAGLERPDAGTIRIAGVDTADTPPWRRNLGMVFQHYAIFPHLSVEANVAYGLKVRGLSTTDTAARVASTLELVGLAGFQKNNATTLSGGEQQRVALARALAPEPSILLLDEPLSALDEKIRREMQTELKHIQRKTGTTFLYVTHDQEEALTMSDRIAVLNAGVCVQCDRPETIYRQPRTRFVASFFRGCNVLDGTVVSQAGRPALKLADAVVEGLDLSRYTQGARVGVGIRAENLRLEPRAAAPGICLNAQVEEIVYRGANFDHRFRLSDGQSLIASMKSPGTSAQSPWPLAFDMADLIVLED